MEFPLTYKKKKSIAVEFANFTAHKLISFGCLEDSSFVACHFYYSITLRCFVQAPQKHQKYVSHVLGLPMSKVVCRTKRIGGGFGGKETRSAFLAAVASVPSYLLNRPVKLTLDRDVDMMTTGQRHSFFGKYKVLFPFH